MKISISIYRKLLILFFCTNAFVSNAQSDTNLIKRIPADTIRQKLSMDAVYNRPFLTIAKLPVAIGGYLEANTQYASTDGVDDGFSFQMRRMTLFLIAI